MKYLIAVAVVAVAAWSCRNTEALETQTAWSGELDIAATVTDLYVSGNVYLRVVPGAKGLIAVEALDTTRYRLLTALDSTAAHFAIRIDEPQQYAGSEPQPPCTLTVTVDTTGALMYWNLENGALAEWAGDWRLATLSVKLDAGAQATVGTLDVGHWVIQAANGSRLTWQEVRADSIDVVAQDGSQVMGYQGRIGVLKAMASQESDVIVNQVMATRVRIAAQQASDVSVQVEAYADLQAHTNSEVRYTGPALGLTVKERVSTGGHIKRLKGAAEVD